MFLNRRNIYVFYFHYSRYFNSVQSLEQYLTSSVYVAPQTGQNFFCMCSPTTIPPTVPTTPPLAAPAIPSPVWCPIIPPNVAPPRPPTLAAFCVVVQPVKARTAIKTNANLFMCLLKF